MKKTICPILLAAAMLAGCSFSTMASNGIGFSRSHGVIGRVGVGAPTNFDAGFGYQFCPHFGLTAEVMGFSGLTSLAGVLDARCHILDQIFTPFVDVKLGYGLLGEDYDYVKCYGVITTATAGLSWRRFDLGAGIMYDPFHKACFTTNLSWTFNFRR